MKVVFQKCPACGSDQVKSVKRIDNLPAIIFPVDQSLSDKVPCRNIHISDCDICGHIFQSNYETEFNKELYKNWYKFYPFSKIETMSDVYRIPFEVIFDKCISGSRGNDVYSVLEVGCSDVAQLELYRARNMNIVAMNPVVSQDCDIPFIEGFYGLDKIEEEFDFVVARFVLEHIENLDIFFNALSSNLKPGGRSIIQVPNCARFLNDGIINFFAHEHVHYFTHHSIVTMIHHYGFCVENISDAEQSSIIIVFSKRDSNKLQSSLDRSVQVGVEIRDFIKRSDGKVVLYGAGLSLSGMLYDVDIEAFRDKVIIVDDNPVVANKNMPRFSSPIVDFDSVCFGQVSDIILLLNPVYHSRVLATVMKKKLDAIKVYSFDGLNLKAVN